MEKTGLPVRSVVLKPCAGRLVVGWVTTSEYLLLIVLDFLQPHSAAMEFESQAIIEFVVELLKAMNTLAWSISEICRSSPGSFGVALSC